MMMGYGMKVKRQEVRKEEEGEGVTGERITKGKRGHNNTNRVIAQAQSHQAFPKPGSHCCAQSVQKK
jgi:hypothetical protein